jgi:hypothetical protein
MLKTTIIPQERQITLAIPANYVGIKLEMLIYPAEEIEIAKSIGVIEPFPRKRPVFGCLNGQIIIADDFDAPLEDFAEYM